MGRSPISLINSDLLSETLQRAESSARQRSNHNFHADAAENPHRFLNAFIRGTYCAPHRHAVPPKAESFVVLMGSIAVFVFDDSGRVSERHVLDAHSNFGIDLAPGVWHTLAPVSAKAVCFEVKPGPYDPLNDKEFAEFAPREGDPEAARYLTELMRGL